MTAASNWYCRNKTPPAHIFDDFIQLGQNLRRITKNLVVDFKQDIYNEHDSLLEECEHVVNLYWQFKDEMTSKDFQSLGQKFKIKRNPYNVLLMRKLNVIIEVNDRRYSQFTFILKKMIIALLRKSLQSEMWLNWSLQLIQLYNKCGDPSTSTLSTKSTINANICSNLYPSLLLPFRSIDFSFALQLIVQQRVEHNFLDLIYGVLNLDDHFLHTWPTSNINESNCSSLEVLQVLTLSGDESVHDSRQHQSKGCSTNRIAKDHLYATEPDLNERNIHLFLNTEREFLTQIVTKFGDICPSVFGQKGKQNLKEYVQHGTRLMWSYIGIVLDHAILWWIETPISCYSLSHINGVRQRLYSQTLTDVPEPVYSTLQGVAEVLTNFVSNNLWDRLFRLTLISNEATEPIMLQFLESNTSSQGTATGMVWLELFHNLVEFSNDLFRNFDPSNTNLLPVAEQIPILHRIDHSVHCMRLWVREESKRLCNTWDMMRFFQILEFDVQRCLKVFEKFKLPQLTTDLSDILMLVCTALRTKLICEVNVNIDNLKKTTGECVQVLADVCRLLSLANFNLCFPAASFWQKSTVANAGAKCEYVVYVLDQIYLPCIKATKDIVVLKLILKIICESWLDFIYQQQIHFSLSGAMRLLSDFDAIRKWLEDCSLLDGEQFDKLSNHEVLRMCKGVGKILLRKPQDVISITQSPIFDRKIDETAAALEGTQLPSEMFVSNQKHWLRLRATKNSLFTLPVCCTDSSV